MESNLILQPQNGIHEVLADNNWRQELMTRYTPEERRGFLKEAEQFLIGEGILDETPIGVYVHHVHEVTMRLKALEEKNEI